MPILEPILLSETPLTQGDVLRGISLYMTGSDWDGGGSPLQIEAEHCMVISRPCACVFGQKEQITVVSIEEFTTSTTTPDSKMDAYRRFFSNLRDGRDMPDRFYIGAIPGIVERRYCARLDSSHALQLPAKREVLERFVKEKRIARLSRDFARDLHLRVFRAFSELGFDDFSWYDTNDLMMVITAGKKELAQKQVDLSAAELDLQNKLMQGTVKEQHKRNLTNAVDNIKLEIDRIRREAEPFQRELLKRGIGADQTVT